MHLHSHRHVQSQTHIYLYSHRPIYTCTDACAARSRDTVSNGGTGGGGLGLGGGDGDANGTVYILTVHCTVQYTARYTATARMLTSRRVDNAMRAYSTHGIYAYFCRERYCVLAYAPACIYTYILYTRINATPRDSKWSIRAQDAVTRHSTHVVSA